MSLLTSSGERSTGKRARGFVRKRTYLLWPDSRGSLAKKGIGKDFAFSGPSEIDFIHRTVGNGELYFLQKCKRRFGGERL